MIYTNINRIRGFKKFYYSADLVEKNEHGWRAVIRHGKCKSYARAQQWCKAALVSIHASRAGRDLENAEELAKRVEVCKECGNLK